MKKFLKITLWTLLTVFLILTVAFGAFIYKVKYGFPLYETEKPTLSLQKEDFNVLIFSKTNGFNHSDAIEASKPAFDKLAADNNWKLFITDEGGVFNAEQLPLFDVVVWNNTSGKVLKDEQREAFKNYLENGGGFVGMHAAGDGSHHWDWYYDNLIQAEFSHHPIKNHIQTSTVILQSPVDSTLALNLDSKMERADEWYIFKNNPQDKGATVLYAMDGNAIDPDGNMLWIKENNWGMGEFHPNVWYNNVGQGRTFYTAMGHTKETFDNKNYLQMLKNAIEWAGRKAKS